MSVLGWGKAENGSLGTGSAEISQVKEPVYLKSLEKLDITSISSGENHLLVSLSNGSVLTSGVNDYNQCGRSSNCTNLGKIESIASHHVLKVHACSFASVVLTEAHEVLTWGRNDQGQLGRGEVTEELQRIPKLVKSLAVHCVLQVSCGSSHVMVLTNESLVGVWGGNGYGQLGLGPQAGEFKNIPEFVTCLKGIPVLQVSAGADHSFVVSKSGAVYGWGRNSFGQLGVNDTNDRNIPVSCRSVRNQRIKYMCCGEDHSAALTADGRVFTFGSGNYGQLGHNSYNNEILPRQVIELSGSEVTQIACGRWHTLAYVPKTCKLYAFGRGESGQLGLSSNDNKNSPFFIKWPSSFATGAKPNSRGSPMQVNNQAQPLRVKTIFADADRSFVVAKDEESCSSDDFRLRSPSSQILTLTSKSLEPFKRLQPQEIPPHEISDEITKIFSFASCLNGSFLLQSEEHYGSSRRKHGIDMNAVRNFFQQLQKLSNIVIIQRISASIEQDLIPMLPMNPPDVEALRLYLMLPECHLFDSPKHYSSIICPFANSVLSLNKVALETFDFWWPSNQPSFFNRLVVVYKQCIEYLLQLPDTNNPLEVSKRQGGLLASMKILSKLNKVNDANNQMIPYHKFYVPELKDRVNIRNDYISWVQQTQHQQQVGGVTVQGLHFCNYPFLFDGAAKSVLLQTDAAMQMQHAIENVQRRNLMGLFTGITSQTQQFDPVNPCLVLQVSRQQLVNDTLRELQGKHSADLKKPLKVVFIGEDAVDEGGVRKEFFMLLLREVLNPIFGMFHLKEQSHLIWFDSRTFEEPPMFHLIGVLIGLAIYNFTIIALDFPLCLYKKMLKRDVNLDDLKELMPDVGKNLQDMLDYDGDDFVDVFSLSFEYVHESFGETTSLELCPGGAEKSVDQSNKNEFVDLYVDYILNKSVDTQFKAFNEGFHSVCGGKVLELFHPQELQAMVVGNEDYDFNEFEKNTEYKGEYHKYHQTIKLFWEVFHEMSLEDKKKFLLFLTGSDRIPVFGMKYVKMIIQPTGGGENYLPVAHTCFNVLDLPKYTNKETMKKKLTQAVEQTEGFGLV